MRIPELIHLKPEEEILLMVRESVVPRLSRMLGVSVLVLLPFFFLYPLFRLGVIGVILFFLIVIPATAALWRLYRMWADTLLVITDRRVIDVERRGVFDVQVTEAFHSDVDEVSYRRRGPVAVLARYGNIEVKVAGAAADMEFRHMPNPERIHDLLSDLRHVAREPEAHPNERRVRTLARTADEEELAALERRVRDRERREAVETFYEDASHDE